MATDVRGPLRDYLVSTQAGDPSAFLSQGLPEIYSVPFYSTRVFPMCQGLSLRRTEACLLFLLTSSSIAITQLPSALDLGTGDQVWTPKALSHHLAAHANNHPYHPPRDFQMLDIIPSFFRAGTHLNPKTLWGPHCHLHFTEEECEPWRCQRTCTEAEGMAALRWQQCCFGLLEPQHVVIMWWLCSLSRPDRNLSLSYHRLFVVFTSHQKIKYVPVVSIFSQYFPNGSLRFFHWRQLVYIPQEPSGMPWVSMSLPWIPLVLL